jgi:hypothetical protein
MQGSKSKLRNVYGEAHRDKYEDVKPHDATTEGSLIDANTHFLAVNLLYKINISYHGLLVAEAVFQLLMLLLLPD